MPALKRARKGLGFEAAGPLQALLGDEALHLNEANLYTRRRSSGPCFFLNAPGLSSCDCFRSYPTLLANSVFDEGWLTDLRRLLLLAGLTADNVPSSFLKE